MNFQKLSTPANDESSFSGVSTSPKHPQWSLWARKLQRMGVHGWLADLIEASGSLSIVAAQMVYISQPVLSLAFPSRDLQVLAEMLEDPSQTQSFAALLREEAA